MPASPRRANRPADTMMVGDLRGANRLLVEAVTGTTDLVEAVHARILGLPRRVLGLAAKPATDGIPGLAYAGVRGVARLAGRGIDEVLQRLPATSTDGAWIPHREALVAALNGVLGDRLAATGNPLAVPPRLRVDGRALDLRRAALASAFPDARERLLVMVHGLCMNDLQWQHDGRHLGRALADDLGCSLVHLHYNSGLSIEANGRQFSALMQELADAWPRTVERITVIGHSMGGLVARAAIAVAQGNGSRWLAPLDQLVTLGTPHLGAPLERAGNLLQALLGMNAHAAPFAALGGLRSAGIRDLRHGLPARRTPLPAHVQAYAVAATLRDARARSTRLLPGDGLVPVASALGEHADPRKDLGLAAEHRLLVRGTGHLGLLGNDEVHARLRHWLA